MAHLFQTLKQLPDMGNRRFSLLELGTQNVELLRVEHARLRNACAALLGIDPDALTYEDVESLASRRLEPTDAAPPE